MDNQGTVRVHPLIIETMENVKKENFVKSLRRNVMKELCAELRKEIAKEIIIEDDSMKMHPLIVGVLSDILSYRVLRKSSGTFAKATLNGITCGIYINEDMEKLKERILKVRNG